MVVGRVMPHLRWRGLETEYPEGVIRIELA